MSYDIYCYRPTSTVPDEDDANRAIELDDNKYSNAPDEPETKLAITRALIDYNPALLAVDFKYGEIANLPLEVLKNDPARFHHIEVNTPDGAPSAQLTIYNNHVWINFPYWYGGSDANKLLKDIREYIVIIRKTAGFFVFDPQLGQVFDPDVTMPDFIGKYEQGVELVKEYVLKNDYKIPAKKPWWKFW